VTLFIIFPHQNPVCIFCLSDSSPSVPKAVSNKAAHIAICTAVLHKFQELFFGKSVIDKFGFDVSKGCTGLRASG